MSRTAVRTLTHNLLAGALAADIAGTETRTPNRGRVPAPDRGRVVADALPTELRAALVLNAIDCEASVGGCRRNRLVGGDSRPVAGNGCWNCGSGDGRSDSARCRRRLRGERCGHKADKGEQDQRGVSSSQRFSFRRSCVRLRRRSRDSSTIVRQQVLIYVMKYGCAVRSVILSGDDDERWKTEDGRRDRVTVTEALSARPVPASRRCARRSAESARH